MLMLGTPGRIRTCDLELRSLLLYPAELPGHVRIDGQLSREQDFVLVPSSSRFFLSVFQTVESAKPLLGLKNWVGET